MDDLSLDKFLQGRASEAMYHESLSRFVPSIVGRRLFKKRVYGRPQKDESLYSASDEAFMLLVLENSWDRWMDIYEKRTVLSTPRPRIRVAGRKSREWKFVSDQRTKYTTGGIRYRDDSEGKPTNGWTPEGIKRYNSLFRTVKVDRLRYPNAFKGWLDEYLSQAEEEPTPPAPSGSSISRSTPISSDLYHELGVGEASVSTTRNPSQATTVAAMSEPENSQFLDDVCGSDENEDDEISLHPV